MLKPMISSRVSRLACRATVALAAVAALTVASPTQVANAACTSIPSTADPNVIKVVYRVGADLNVSDKVMLAAFEAGWVESHMNNLPCGDRDSLGVFQQRPSQGWGEPSQILNVAFASNSFFVRAIPAAANHPGWTAGQVAQEVQRSAFPSRYDQAESTARALIDQARRLQHGTDTVGWYRNSDSSFHLRNSLSGGESDAAFVFGPNNSGDIIAVTGDWDGNGTTTVGWYRRSDSSWHLRNSHSGGESHAAFVFGPANSGGIFPITGDWNGDGRTTVGWYRNSDSSFHLRNSLSGGESNYAFVFGPNNSGGIVPVTGDWDGNGHTTVGWYRASDSSFHLRNSHSGGESHYAFVFGPANSGGIIPVTGDWDRNGHTTVGWYRASDSSWHLRNSHSGGESHAAFVFGPNNSGGIIPVTGDWNRA